MTHHDAPILIVEDTPEYAQLISITLERFGYEVFHAPDGETAVEFIQDQSPALILLDLNLPGMSGWQVLEEVTAHYGKQMIPVIVTTAYSDSANRVIGKLQEVHQYLVKPFTPDDLRSAIEGALGIQKT